MAFTDDTYLPTIQELTVPEINLTTAPLLAAAKHLGKYCDEKCKEFMLCYQETLHNPVLCLKEGKEVTACGIEFFKKVKTNCANEFAEYHYCLDKKSGFVLDLKYCRDTQYIFDDCMEQQVGIPRPEFGYFSKIRLHKTDRPRYEIKLAPMPREIPDEPNFIDTVDPELALSFMRGNTAYGDFKT